MSDARPAEALTESQNRWLYELERRWLWLHVAMKKPLPLGYDDEQVKAILSRWPVKEGA